MSPNFDSPEVTEFSKTGVKLSPVDWIEGRPYNTHICDEVIESCTGNFMNISILPAGTTSVLQSLYISINKIFKTFIKEK